MAATNCTKEIAEFYQLTQSKLARIWERDGRRCRWCNIETILTRHTIPNQATMDHVLPAAKGGSNDESNLVLACLKCNSKRGSCGVAPINAPTQWRKTYAAPSAKELINEPLERELEMARASYGRMKDRVEYLESLTIMQIVKMSLLRWVVTKIRRWM